jgi:5-bromo-4-chloroindolyl phosphate hydrolysis protein
MGEILIWSELSIPLFILVLVLVLILVLMVVFLSRVERVAIEIAFATVDQSDIRGSKPHNRDPSGAASH